MKSNLETLRIHNFRTFRDLEVRGLGHVNLVTGRNNSGKSSLLEAIRLIASDASPAVLSSILNLREEDAGESEGVDREPTAEPGFPFASLFYGFPSIAPKMDGIRLDSRRGGLQLKLGIGVGWVSRSRTDDVSRLNEISTGVLFPDSDRDQEPVLVVEKEGTPIRVLPFNSSWRRSAYPNMFLRIETEDRAKPPCQFLRPYGGERTSTFGALWDNIALSDFEGEVVDALRLIAPEIRAISMVGGRRSRTAIVRAEGFQRPVPLRSFGDGLNRVFGIALSLVNARGGILLVDEFENGLHHTVQEDVWRTVFRLAKRMDIQVFATTHSWDCIEAFQKAAAEVPEEGVLIRLSRKGERMFSTVFQEDELATVTRGHIEVR